MKRINGIIILWLATVILGGCGAVKEVEETTLEQNMVPMSDTIIQEVSIGSDMADYLDKLGEPDEINSAKSCTGNGEDKSFVYSDITIYTKPDSNGSDIVYLIEYDGNATLASGIGIGSTTDEVKASYGENYIEEADYLVYEFENQSISFEVLDEKVVFIEIY